MQQRKVAGESEGVLHPHLAAQAHQRRIQQQKNVSRNRNITIVMLVFASIQMSLFTVLPLAQWLYRNFWLTSWQQEAYYEEERDRAHKEHMDWINTNGGEMGPAVAGDQSSSNDQEHHLTALTALQAIQKCVDENEPTRVHFPRDFIGNTEDTDRYTRFKHLAGSAGIYSRPIEGGEGDDKVGRVCEGYWRDAEDPHAQANINEREAAEQAAPMLPWPVVNARPWCGHREWLHMLKTIEDSSSGDGKGGVQATRFRGMSYSRIEGEMSLLGNKEFIDEQFFFRTTADGKAADTSTLGQVRRRRWICWTGDLREHYVAKYNVVPSKEFFYYVIEKYKSLV